MDTSAVGPSQSTYTPDTDYDSSSQGSGGQQEDYGSSSPAYQMTGSSGSGSDVADIGGIPRMSGGGFGGANNALAFNHAVTGGTAPRFGPNGQPVTGSSFNPSDRPANGRNAFAGSPSSGPGGQQPTTGNAADATESGSGSGAPSDGTAQPGSTDSAQGGQQPGGSESPQGEQVASAAGDSGQNSQQPNVGDASQGGQQPVVGDSNSGTQQPRVGDNGNNGGTGGSNPTGNTPAGGNNTPTAPNGPNDRNNTNGNTDNKDNKDNKDGKDTKDNKDNKPSPLRSVLDSVNAKTRELVKNIETGLAKVRDGKVVQGLAAVLGSDLQKLNFQQGYAVPGVQGTCGLVSNANIEKALKMGETLLNKGRDALNSLLGSGRLDNTKLEREMVNNFDHGAEGGTTWDDQIRNLQAKGIYGGSGVVNADQLAQRVAEGRGVQININASQLYGDQWNGEQWRNGPFPNHAVSVHGVREGADGKREFAVADSSGMRAGRGMLWIPESRLQDYRGGIEATWTRSLRS